MDLTTQELIEIRHVVNYYMHHHISVKSPRYNEYEVLLKKLTDSIAKQQ